jgi:hypothetical protein
MAGRDKYVLHAALCEYLWLEGSTWVDAKAMPYTCLVVNVAVSGGNPFLSTFNSESSSQPPAAQPGEGSINAGGTVGGVAAGALGTAGVMMLVKKKFSAITVGAE